MSAGTQRKLSTSSHSIDDYPEHLNPFHEEDNHNKIRFWTVGRKSFRERSGSFSLSGLKDFRSTWSFKSFMKKGRRDSVTPTTPKDSSTNSSPIILRKPLGESVYNGFSRSTVTATPSDRYMYGGSITPLPRSRFQERVSHLEYRSPNSNQLRLEEGSAADAPGNLSVTNGNKFNGSCLSVESTNAFGENPVRASIRKKRRAPPPPPLRTFTSIGNVQVLHTSNTSEQINSSSNDSKPKQNFEPSVNDIDINDPSLNVELKIIEENDINDKDQHLHTANGRIRKKEFKNKLDQDSKTKVHICLQIPDIIPDTAGKPENENQNERKDDEIDPRDLFHKVDIDNYKRKNSIDLTKSTENLGEEVVPPTDDANKAMEQLETTVADDNNKHSENIHNERTQKTEISDEKLSPPNKKKIDTIDNTMKDFLDIDKATLELEMEIKKLNEEMDTMYENEPYKRKTVSDIKLIFDSPGDPNTPNPIPKPRRTRLSISSNESNPVSPIKERKVLS